jgi:hypothetical protein
MAPSTGPPPGAVVPKLLTLVAAADYLAGRGVRVTIEAIRNWIVIGGRGPNGRVRLKSYWIGGRHYTKRKWLREYIAAVTEARLPAVPADQAPKETPRERQARFQREKQQLDDLLKRTRLRTRKTKA